MMLNNDEDLDYITATTGISFDLFIHLFLSTNIPKYAVISVVNWYTASLKKMKELEQIVTEMGLFKIEATTCKYKVQVLCFQYMLVSKRKNSPYLLSHIGLKLLVYV